MFIPAACVGCSRVSNQFPGFHQPLSPMGGGDGDAMVGVKVEKVCGLHLHHP